MKKIAAIALIFVYSSLHAEQSLEERINSIQFQPPNQLLSDYDPKIEMFYHSLNYATFFCTDPHTSVLVNLTAAGMQNYGPPYDGLYLKREQEIKNCVQISPDVRFKTTNAISVYARGFGSMWVTGIKDQEGKIVGYIPINSIQFIPIPTI